MLGRVSPQRTTREKWGLQLAQAQHPDLRLRLTSAPSTWCTGQLRLLWRRESGDPGPVHTLPFLPLWTPAGMFKDPSSCLEETLQWLLRAGTHGLYHQQQRTDRGSSPTCPFLLTDPHFVLLYLPSDS